MTKVVSKSYNQNDNLLFPPCLGDYIAENDPVRGFCYKAKADRRTIEVNHRNNELKAQARERLMSEEGLYHRSMRPVEPEAVFGQIKYDGGFKRFRYRGSALTSAEFATVAIAHNIKKMISVMEAGAKRSRRLCYLAKSPTLLTPKEASSLAVKSHPSTKKATNNHLLVAFFLIFVQRLVDKSVVVSLRLWDHPCPSISFLRTVSDSE